VSAILASELDYRVLVRGLDHVEGVCWDPRRRCVWAGGEAGQIYRIELDGSVTLELTITGGALLGLALGLEGDLYVCDPGNEQIWRVDETKTARAFGEPLAYPNYPAFGPDGRLYVSDSGSFFEATGRVVAIDPNGVTHDVSPRPIAFANGLAFSGDTLWVVESSAPGVSAMDIHGGPLEMVVEMERCVPDGLAFDAEGGLWISCYQPNQIWRWTHDRGLHLVVDEWSGEQILTPTNVAFIGDDLGRLALASLCGHDVTTINPGVRGALVQYLEEEIR